MVPWHLLWLRVLIYTVHNVGFSFGYFGMENGPDPFEISKFDNFRILRMLVGGRFVLVFLIVNAVVTFLCFVAACVISAGYNKWCSNFKAR